MPARHRLAIRVPEPAALWAGLRRAWAALRRLPAQAWAALGRAWRDPEYLVVLGILVLGGVLRLSRLDLIEFRADQAATVADALSIRQGHLLPMALGGDAGAGATSLMAYLTAALMALRADPRFVAAGTGLAELGVMVWLYLRLRRHYGLRVAIIALLLAAASPWSVLAARRVSAEALLPLLSCALFVALSSALFDRDARGWLAAPFLVGLVALTGPGALPLAVTVAALALLGRRRLDGRALALGTAVAAAMLAPALYATRALDAAAPVRATLAELWRLAVAAHVGGAMEALAGPSYDVWLVQTTFHRGATLLAGVWFGLALAYCALRAWRAWSRWREGDDAARYLLPLVWVLAVASLTELPHGASPADLGALFPAGLVAMAIGLDRLWAWVERPRPAGMARAAAASTARTQGLGVLLWLGLIALVISWSRGAWALYDLSVGHETAGGYGVPYRYWRRTAALVSREVEAMGTDQVWIYTDGDDPAADETPLILDAVLRPAVETVYMADPAKTRADNGGRDGDATGGGLARPGETGEGLLLPAERGAVYLFTRSSPLAEAALAELGAENRGMVVFPSEDDQVYVSRLAARPAEELLARAQVAEFRGLDAGLRLLGYDWPADAAPGRRLTLTTYWTFADLSIAAPGERELFYDLIGPGGQAAQGRGLALPRREWAEGLLLQQWTPLTLPADAPAGDYLLLVGAYGRDAARWSRYIDPEGYDLGDGIPLGPLSVVAAEEPAEEPEAQAAPATAATPAAAPTATPEALSEETQPTPSGAAAPTRTPAVTPAGPPDQAPSPEATPEDLPDTGAYPGTEDDDAGGNDDAYPATEDTASDADDAYPAGE